MLLNFFNDTNLNTMKSVILCTCFLLILKASYSQQNFPSTESNLTKSLYCLTSERITISKPTLAFTTGNWPINSGNLVLKTISTLPYFVAPILPQDISWQEGMKYNMKQRTLISAGLFIPTIATGYLLSNGNRPPNTALLTIHKLTDVSNLILLDATVLKKRRVTSLTFLEAFTTVTMNICFVGTIATGGMLSMNHEFPSIVKSIHTVTPWLTVLSSGVLLCLLNQVD